MGKVLILGPDRASPGFFTPTFAGDRGQWLPDYPLTNLTTPLSAEQAWSLNLTTDATQFVLDLGTLRSLKGVALPWGNFLADDRVSVDIYDDADLTILKGSVTDSPVHREVYPIETVDWEDEEFWDGRMTEEDREQFPVPWFTIFDEPVIGRYVHVRITATDDGNGARTELRLGRFVATEGYQPTVNAAPGSSIAFEDASIRSTALGGADFYDRREKRRIVTFQFSTIEENEAMANTLDTAYELGAAGQVFIAWDDQDTVHRFRRSMLATVDRLDPLVAQAAGYFGTTWQFREVV